MNVVRTVAECRSALADARLRRRIHFVPTMGALHGGHGSLLERAREGERPLVVVSIFVNPTQFGPSEDFSRYPRDEAGDLALCRDEGVDLVFAPEVAEVYREMAGAAAGATLTTVRVAKLSETLCGPFRPGHFDGVATVVAKLLNIVQPDAAFFGEKDYQQLAIIRRMVGDLSMPVEIVGCRTVREADGLAMSSRNRYLNAAERVQAASLYRGLRLGAGAIEAGVHEAAAVALIIRQEIDAAGPCRVDYISVVDPESLQVVERIEGPVQIALAVRIGSTRLIDNVRVDRRLAQA